MADIYLCLPLSCFGPSTPTTWVALVGFSIWASTKDRKLGGLKQQKCILAVLEEGKTSKCPPSEGSGAGSFPVCPASDGSQHPLACACITPDSIFLVAMAFASLRLLLLCFLKGPPKIQDALISGSLVLSTKTPFHGNRVTFAGTGGFQVCLSL